MNGALNLKIFLSISLGVHLFFLSILTLLFPDFKIDQVPSLHVEVSLLPLIAEAKSLPEFISAPAVRTQIRKEETEAPQQPKEVESSAQQELEQEQRIATFSTTPQNISIEEPALFLPESKKWEMGNRPLPVPSDLDLTIWSDEKPLPVEDSYRKENLSGSLTPSYPERVTRSSVTDSREMSLILSKPKPSSGEKIAFAQPRYDENPRPLYPQEARKRGYQGEVLLKVEILANGRVGRMEVKKSSGYEVLDRSALATVKEWKFIPANQGNGAIPCWVNIPIKFQLQ